MYNNLKQQIKSIKNIVKNYDYLFAIKILSIVLFSVFLCLFSPILLHALGISLANWGYKTGGIACLNVAKRFGRGVTISGQIDYDLSRLKQNTDLKQSIKLLKSAMYSGSAHAAYDLAVYLQIFGEKKEKEYGRKLFELIAISDKNAHSNDAKRILSTLKLYSNIVDSKITWETASKNPEFSTLFDRRPPHLDCLHSGLRFIKNHVCFSYPHADAQGILSELAQAVGPTGEMCLGTLVGVGAPALWGGVSVPGTDFQTGDFELADLLARDMPFKEWGIYWLKRSSVRDAARADRVLAVLEKYEKQRLQPASR